MKTTVLAVAAILALAAAMPAGAVEVLTNSSAAAGARQPDLAALPVHTTLPRSQLSELPEPEVFAMMLLGLVLIGYRASRDSSEKFK